MRLKLLASPRTGPSHLAGASAAADLIELINMIIDHLTERGVMEPKLLYKSPFKAVAPPGLG